MLEKQQNNNNNNVLLNQVLVQGYNLEVHEVIKYTRKHRATIIISRADRFICVT